MSEVNKLLDETPLTSTKNRFLEEELNASISKEGSSFKRCLTENRILLEEKKDYVPEKKKKKMTLKSKRDKRRISPRRMLRSVTKSSISKDTLYNRSRFNTDLSLSESDDASEESEADYEGKCLKLSCTSVPTGYASHNEALQGSLELRSDDDCLPQQKNENESSDEYDAFIEDSVTYSPANPSYAGSLELRSDDDCLPQQKTENESSDEYDAFLEDSVTYSPTNPNYAGTGFDLPQAAVKALQLTAQAQSSPMSGKPSVSVATKCFMLSNMFDPVKETNPTWDEDIKNDVIKECRNHGGALHVHVDKNSPDGNVYVKCPSLTVSAATVRVLHGRYFAGRVINVTYVPEANYQMLFPDSAAAVAVL